MKTWQTRQGSTIRQVLTGRSNVFLVSSRNRNILVDTGRKASRGKLADGLRTLGVARLDALVLTHTHFDHAENAAFIRKEFGARVIVHCREAGFLRKGSTPLPAGTMPLTRLLVRAGRRFDRVFAYEPCEADVEVEDFDLSAFGIDAYCLPTPGHSAGSMSLILERETALVGDAMFGVFPRSVFPPFADDIPLLVESWGKLLLTGCTLFLPGHGSADRRGLLEKCYRRRLRRQAR